MKKKFVNKIHANENHLQSFAIRSHPLHRHHTSNDAVFATLSHSSHEYRFKLKKEGSSPHTHTHTPKRFLFVN